MAVREPTCAGNGVTEVGPPFLFKNAFTFLSCKESQLPIYSWLNIMFLKNLVLTLYFEPRTFSTSGGFSHHWVTATRLTTASRAFSTGGACSNHLVTATRLTTASQAFSPGVLYTQLQHDDKWVILSIGVVSLCTIVRSWRQILATKLGSASCGPGLTHCNINIRHPLIAEQGCYLASQITARNLGSS